MRSSQSFAGMVIIWAAAVWITGCEGSDGGGGTCVPNAQVACACNGGGTGTQVCNAAGDAYGMCSCANTDAGPTLCTNSTECQDGNPCTVGTCQNDTCTYAPAEGSCDDGDACSTNDVCVAGVCRGSGSCSTLECATDAVAGYLETATFCMPAEYARAALPSNIEAYVQCAGAEACATGCPITITARPVTAEFVAAQALGDQARVEADVEVEGFSFTFTTGAGTTLCEHTGTMTVGGGGAARVEVFHTLATDVCAANASSSTASFFAPATSRTFLTSTRPGTGSTETQGECEETLYFLRSYDDDWSSYHDLLIPAWARWAQPSCRDCASGSCPSGVRCEMVPPPAANP